MAPWLLLDRVPAPAGQVAAAGEGGSSGGRRLDWVLDPEFQQALEAAEFERASTCAQVWAQVAAVGAGLPANGGADELDPTLSSAVEVDGEQDRTARFSPVLPQQGVAEPWAAKDNDSSPRVSAVNAIFSGLGGADDWPLAVDVGTQASLLSRCADAGGEVSVGGRGRYGGGTGASPRWGEEGLGKAGNAACSEWARRFVPAHRRAAFPAAAAAGRFEEVSMVAEGGEGVWVTSEELEEARGRVSRSIGGGLIEDMVSTGRCAGWVRC